MGYVEERMQDASSCLHSNLHGSQIAIYFFFSF